jgi:hypothetical protein
MRDPDICAQRRVGGGSKEVVSGTGVVVTGY